MKERLLPFFLCLLMSFSVSAQLRFARIFSDHAVLQRQKSIPVWGWAKPGEAVTVYLNGTPTQTLQAVAAPDGKWQVQFTALEAGGPYLLGASTAAAKLELTDILIGDVWLCSGQSNMEWTVRQADNYLKERKNAEFPKIRHFRVAHEVSLEPQADLTEGAWEPSNAETVGGFTAIGFFFAREVFQQTGIPVGILHSSWGGSQVESWISKEAMLASEVLNGYGKTVPTTWEEADLRLEKSIKKKLLGNPDIAISTADEQKYLQADYDFSNWLTADPMWQWDWKGVWAWRGNGYMGKMVEIPAEMVNQITTLSLADNFNQNEVYINGKLVAKGLFKGASRILIEPNTWKPGLNKLMVKMNRRIEPEWYGLGLMGSDKDLYVSTETQNISLAGNDWKLMPAFAEQHEFAHSSNNVGTAIYNSMIAPLIPYGIRGALWYQGESNAGRAYEYRHSFPLMIKDWRARWKEDFPFYFVQLSSYGPFQNSNEGSDWAELREAQTLTLQLPNTGMAVTTDIGNPKDIHPTNKLDVGKRLAANALKFVYQKDLLYSGPVFETVRFEKERAVLNFKFAGGGLVAKDKYGYLKGFEIAGDDRVFYYAPARIDGHKVIVQHPKGLKPVAVRYAWANSPEDANLFNAEGFPASPFRTDDWEGRTAKGRFE
ncbi:MAG TPA: sialate O-acetylesterase [Saprospiraceae bacterium]|nr:sialate O-acetylesterase [Saprospiraceae bacterium]HPI05214.1 sialate O-acetylesterase [Saprospiraceae bacterium]